MKKLNEMTKEELLFEYLQMKDERDEANAKLLKIARDLKQEYGEFVELGDKREMSIKLGEYLRIQLTNVYRVLKNRGVEL